MQNKLIKKILSVALSLILMCTYFTPFQQTIVAEDTLLPFSDNFQTDNLSAQWRTITLSGTTSSPASRVYDSNTQNYSFKPAVNSTAGGAITIPSASNWTGGRPTSFSFNMLPGSSFGLGDPYVYIYYDEVANARAALRFTQETAKVDSVEKTVLTMGTFVDGTSVVWYAKNTNTEQGGSSLNTAAVFSKTVSRIDPTKNIKIEISYQYTSWDTNGVIKKIPLTIKLTGKNAFTAEDLTQTIDLTVTGGSHFGIKSTAPTPSSNIYAGFSNITTTTRTIVFDDVEIMTTTINNKIQVNNFKAKYSNLLSKSVADVTMSDSTQLGDALMEFNSFDAEAKAMLTNEKALLDGMNTKLLSSIGKVGSDNFENKFITNNIWQTDTITTAPNTSYSIVNYDNTNALLPQLHSTAGSSITRLKDNSKPFGKPQEVTVKFRQKSDATMAGGWFNKIIAAYDPVTKAYFGLEYNYSLVSGVYYLDSRTGSANGVTFTPGGSGAYMARPTTNPIPYDQWITIRATYDYKDWASKKIYITFEFIADNGDGVVKSQYSKTFTVTMPSNVSESILFGFSNESTPSVVYDDFNIVSTYKSSSEKALEYEDYHSAILSKDPTTAFSDSDISKLNLAIQSYMLLETEVKSILITDGTKTKLEALANANSATDTNSAAFKTKYNMLLSKADNQIRPTDEAEVDAALAEFETFSPITKMLLATQKETLDRQKQIILWYIEPYPQPPYDPKNKPFTENFETTLKQWDIQTVANNSYTVKDFSIVEDPLNSANHVLKYQANGAFLSPKSIAWPAKGAMTKVTYKIMIDSISGNPNLKNNVIASYLDPDNMNGFSFTDSAQDGLPGQSKYFEFRFDDGVGSGGRWMIGHDLYASKKWLNVEITYTQTKATISITDPVKNTSLLASIARSRLNGKIAFGAAAYLFAAWTNSPIYIDDINVSFAQADWDIDMSFSDLKVYYSGNTFIKPGEIALIQGEKLGYNIKEAYIMQLADIKKPSDASFVSTDSYRSTAKEGGATPNLVYNAGQKVSIIQSTPASIKFIVPSTFTAGIYAVKLVPIDATQKEVYVYINVPKTSFVLGDEGEISTRGGKIRIIGSNMVPSGNKDDLKVSIIKDGTSNVIDVPVTAVKNNDMYSIEAQIPLNVTDGTYKLFVHNGYGDATAWSSPTEITVAPSPKDTWPTTVFNVKDYGAKADGKVNDTPAIVSALDAAAKNGGGVVYLPKGIYRITHTLVMPENIKFKGDGQDDTRLLADYSLREIGALPKAVVAVSSNVEIYDLSFHGTRRLDFMKGFDTSGNGLKNVSIHDIRTQFYGYVGTPTEGRGGPTVGFDSADEIRFAIHSETYRSYQYDFNVGATNFKFDNVINLTDIGERGLHGFFEYSKISNTNFDNKWWVPRSEEAVIIENIDSFSSCNGADGNFYMSNVNHHNSMFNNRELYTSDGLPLYRDVVVQQIDNETYKVINLSLKANQLVGKGIYVTEGQGLGQVRRIISNTTDTFKVDIPFVVPPNRNSRAHITYWRAGSFFVNNIFDDGQGGGTYGTLVDSVFDGNKFIRHSGQVLNLHEGVLWYFSNINSELIKPWWSHGDGVSAGNSIGAHSFMFQFGRGAASSMGILYKGNKTYDGGSINITFSASGNGTRDFIIENNLFDAGAQYGINTTLANGVTAIEGLILKNNTFNTVERYPADALKAFTSTAPTLNKMGSPRYIDLDLKGISTNLKGDINQDGVVTLKDSTLIRYYLEEKITLTDAQKANLDANVDGVVDLRDATYIRKQLVS
jgi:hypothetical protein